MGYLYTPESGWHTLGWRKRVATVDRPELVNEPRFCVLAADLLNNHGYQLRLPVTVDNHYHLLRFLLNKVCYRQIFYRNGRLVVFQKRIGRITQILRFPQTSWVAVPIDDQKLEKLLASCVSLHIYPLPR